MFQSWFKQWGNDKKVARFSELSLFSSVSTFISVKFVCCDVDLIQYMHLLFCFLSQLYLNALSMLVI